MTRRKIRRNAGPTRPLEPIVAFLLASGGPSGACGILAIGLAGGEQAARRAWLAHREQISAAAVRPGSTWAERRFDHDHDQEGNST